MKISEVAINRPVFTWMLMVAMMLFGFLSASNMGVGLLPDVDYPMVSVSVDMEGASPDVMEVQVVDVLESAILSVQGIQNIYSSAKSGSSSVTVEFELDKNVDVAVQEIQTKLAQSQQFLPKEARTPVVSKVNPEDRPVIWLSVHSDSMTNRELVEFVRDRLKDQFSTISGVAEVFLGGYTSPNLRVWPDAEKLKQHSLTVEDVVRTIQGEHKEVPAGRIENAKSEINVRLLGEASNVKEFEDLRINYRGGSPNYRPIKLKDVAKVEDGLDEIRRKSRTYGVPAIGVGIIKQRGANTVAVAKKVKEKLAEIQKSLPPTVQIGVNFDSTKFIEDAVHELIFTLSLSALLTALVCWFFLGSWSATFNIILSIPTSILGSFMVLKMLNFTLNTFTLLGLSLAIGIVVDDAIMVLENIVRHSEEGKNRKDAAQWGAREISFAALAATMAIMAIFLPVAFMQGVIGKYFFQFGMTISVAVGLSLIEALTFTPMRCSQFLKVGERSTRLGKAVDKFFHDLVKIYRVSLDAVLRHPWKTIMLSLIFFVMSFALAKFIKKEFVPSQDQSMLLVRLKTPEGSSIDFTDKRAMEVEKILKTYSEIRTYYLAVGGFGGGDVNTAMVFISMKEFKDRGINPLKKKTLSQQEFSDVLREALKNIPDVQAYIQDLSQGQIGARRGYPVEFTIQGPDWKTLTDLNAKMEEEMKKSGLMTDVSSDFVPGMPELKIYPNRVLASQYGVSISEIGSTVNALVGGSVVGMYTQNGKRYDIRVRLPENERGKFEDLNRLMVRNNRGELVPLSRVVDIKQGEGPQTISRMNRSRSIGLSANVAPNSSQGKALEKVQEIANKILPAGYYLVMSGNAKTFGESFRGLLFALLFGILISYMILASQFNNYVHPITVLMAMPFSISGAFIALWLTGKSLNMFSMIGLILLMGIVKKNSILLVDFTNQLKEQGKNTLEALKEACPLRLRAILMTSFSTVAAAVPVAMHLGPGAEANIPMAIAVIGGVLVSTFLTLLVVPCVYLVFDRKRKAKI